MCPFKITRTAWHPLHGMCEPALSIRLLIGERLHMAFTKQSETCGGWRGGKRADHISVSNSHMAFTRSSNVSSSSRKTNGTARSSRARTAAKAHLVQVTILALHEHDELVSHLVHRRRQDEQATLCWQRAAPRNESSQRRVALVHVHHKVLRTHEDAAGPWQVLRLHLEAVPGHRDQKVRACRRAVVRADGGQRMRPAARVRTSTTMRLSQRDHPSAVMAGLICSLTERHASAHEQACS